MQFLVIDDDELSRELLAVLLGAEGHEVEIAASGEEALALLHRERGPSPDVVLSDMQMPGISGRALAAALRQACGNDAKLLGMSASQPAEAALDGFDGFLLKPFSASDLDALLTSAGEAFAACRRDGAAGVTEADFQVPALNEDIYARMAQMMPGPQLGQMYAMCLADARTRLEEMATLAGTGDDAGYRNAAHTVKGGCGMIGATELYRLAESAENDGLLPNSELEGGNSEAFLVRFSLACDRLHRILEERAQENPAPAPGDSCR